MEALTTGVNLLARGGTGSLNSMQAKQDASSSLHKSACWEKQEGFESNQMMYYIHQSTHLFYDWPDQKFPGHGQKKGEMQV